MSEQPTLTSPTDKELVEAAQMGSTAALERLIERYFRIVYSIAYARLHQREAAEDLVQEVFLSVYLKLGKLKNPNLFGLWVNRIARNAAINWLDKGLRQSKLAAMVPLDEKTEQAMAEKAEGEMQKNEERERGDAVRAAIFRLPIDQREIVLMRYIEGISVEEISQRTGIHTRTVWRQLNRSMAQLKTSIESMLADAAPSIRASRSTATRTLAILGAASVLSASTKSAMAASATAVLAGECLATISTAVDGAASVSLSAKTFGILKTITATGVAGGKIMGLGKLVAVGAVGVTVLVGGKHYYEKSLARQQAALTEQTVSAASSAAAREPGKVVIEKSRTNENSMQSSQRRISIKGRDVEGLIYSVYGFHRNRCRINAALPEGKYDVTLEFLPGQAGLREAILRQGFEDYFGLTNRKEMQEMDVLVMTAPSGTRPAMQPSPRGQNQGMMIKGHSGGGLSGTNVDMLNLAGNLEININKPVINESGLSGEYDITLRFNQNNPQSIIAAARDQLGVVLTPARRKVEMLIIENRK